MIKSVLLHVHEDDAMEGRLQVALDVCRAQGAHLSCLYVTPYNAYITIDPFGGASTQGALLDKLQQQQDRLRSRFESQLKNEDVAWDWAAADGDVASVLVAASALSDLLVVSQYDRPGSHTLKPLPIADAVALHAACPVLVVPSGVNGIKLSEASVIGWNASPESAHAVRAAVPMLLTASFVHIASVGGDGEEFPQVDANSYLSRHGIKSDLHELPGSSRSAAKALHDFALSKHASLLVMGAYGRSRFRETLLGGVTRSLLSTSQVPLLLAH